ncbi:hypothetical protein D3C80_1734410 [compost metagenome]
MLEGAEEGGVEGVLRVAARRQQGGVDVLIGRLAAPQWDVAVYRQLRRIEGFASRGRVGRGLEAAGLLDDRVRPLALRRLYAFDDDGAGLDFVEGGAHQGEGRVFAVDGMSGRHKAQSLVAARENRHEGRLERQAGLQRQAELGHPFGRGRG